ncbi:NnrS family protein [uncultured Microbulbifer sp.]|uniref:NnrS family protein n=1 Tax=uncultured Microbulbifer sp. TaxID=348147 RepID=UPI00262ED9B7|nr:NnrS family protein [uncultured Microbulbifer sp.]
MNGSAPRTRDSAPGISGRQLFAYPFRIFFLSAAFLALFAIPLWLMLLFGAVSLPTAIPPLFWHQHEMLFGFLSAAIAGFILTAVCVWTGTERTHGVRLLLLWMVWLAGRLLLLFGAGLPPWLVIGVNLAFLPLVALDLLWRIVRGKQWRHLMLLLVMTLLWLMQLAFLTNLDMRYAYGALIMAMALISIVGGRITPAFTANWLRARGADTGVVNNSQNLALVTLVTMLLLLAAVILGAAPAAGVLASIAAVLMLWRLWQWQGWRARGEPLLWILHVSILWVPVALLLLVGHLFLGWPVSAWTHAAGTGAIGSLILGVMARVCLGHTGRALVLPKGMVFAFWAVNLSVLLRIATGFGWIPMHPGLGSSAMLWMLAYGIFLWRYSGILASPRPDGKVG